MLTLTLFFILLGFGAISGFLAGLLGVGGGLIIVPVVTGVLSTACLGGAHTHHLAVGTSLAVMVFTSLSSVYAHHKHDAVDWLLIRNMAPAMILGALLGSVIAGQLSGTVLKWFFIVYLYFIGIYMLNKYTPSQFSQRQLPGKLGQWNIGSIIGIVSSLIGIGGGSMSIPFMVCHQVPVRTAIATSAALGWPITVAGTLGYIINGLYTQGLPWGSIGYVYLPATLVLLMMTLIFAPLGVRMAHSLPTASLKRLFTFLLLIIATQMLYELLEPHWA